jgi:hypothetical protein
MRMPTTRRTRRQANQPGLLLKRYSSTSQAKMANPIRVSPSGSGMLQRHSPGACAMHRDWAADQRVIANPASSISMMRSQAKRASTEISIEAGYLDGVSPADARSTEERVTFG